MRFAEAVQAAKADGGIVSPTYFRDGISPGAYSISVVDGWEYKDRPPVGSIVTSNNLPPLVSTDPHLILYDAIKTPRFVLGYHFNLLMDDIRITALQRMRTRYDDGVGASLRWDAEAETQASKEFQEALAGMHPAEFLMAEFLYQHRDFLRPRILHGTNALFIQYPFKRESEPCFKPLVERYFRRNQYGQVNYYSLSLNPQKQRVRVILGLDEVARESVPEIALPEDVARVAHG